MILGLGCDFINIERLKNEKDFLTHFEKRILGADELREIALAKLSDLQKKASLLAKYYAGKEAFVKALGTGFRDGIFFRDIQILHTDLGKPYLKVSGTAYEYLQKMSKNAKTYITLSDDYPYAQAVVVIEE